MQGVSVTIVTITNSMQDLQRFFSTKDKPCTISEMRTFWTSLTGDEKDYYKTAPLNPHA